MSLVQWQLRYTVPRPFPIFSILPDFSSLASSASTVVTLMSGSFSHISRLETGSRLPVINSSIRSWLGLRFVRELEQGKETVRMDKVNTALAMFDMQAVPGRKYDK